MEFMLNREEFEIQVTKEVIEFFKKHCKNIGHLPKNEFTRKIDSFFGRNSKLSKMATETGSLGKLNTESTELLIRTVLEFSFNNYKVDMEQKNNELSFLRRELREAQRKSRDKASSAKKASETREKERIISQKNAKLDKLNKENDSLKSNWHY
jgi:hypothetical protein